LDSFDAYWFSQQIFQRYWKKYQIVFLLSYEEVPFEEDGVRSEDLQYRRDIHELFLMAVEHYKMHNVVHLGGSVEERLKIIKSTFDNIEI
jgi:nicotinamide riboside kinase